MAKNIVPKTSVERKSSFVTAFNPENGQPISLSLACTWKLNKDISGLTKFTFRNSSGYDGSIST